MNVTPKQVKAQRELLIKKLKDYVPESLSDRVVHCIVGFGLFALFPVLAASYPSCMFMAYMVLSILLCLQVTIVGVMSFSIQIMKQMPIDIRKMQYTLLGNADHRIVNMIIGPIFCWAVFNAGFQALAVAICLLSILLFIINTQYRAVCNSTEKF